MLATRNNRLQVLDLDIPRTGGPASITDISELIKTCFKNLKQLNLRFELAYREKSFLDISSLPKLTEIDITIRNGSLSLQGYQYERGPCHLSFAKLPCLKSLNLIKIKGENDFKLHPIIISVEEIPNSVCKEFQIQWINDRDGRNPTTSLTKVLSNTRLIK